MRSFHQQITRVGRALLLPVFVLFVAAGDLAAQPARTGLHGYVHNTEGGKVTPIPGAEIQFFRKDGEVAASAKSDKSGYYSAALRAGEYTFQVTASGYKSEKSGRGLQLRLSEGYAVHNFTLIKGKDDPNQKAPELTFAKVGELRGQVYEKTPEGDVKGVSGAVVTLRPTKKSEPPKQVFTSPPSDTGEFPSGYKVLVAAGTWRASISAPGFDTLVHPEEIEVEADKMAIQDFILTRPTPSKQGIKGVVRVSGNEPLPDSVKVIIKKAGEANAKNAKTMTPVVDTEGRFEEELPAGRYVVTAEAADFESLSKEVVDVLPKGFSSITLTLRKTKTILVVTVRDRETNRPLAKALVRARQPDEPISKAAQ